MWYIIPLILLLFIVFLLFLKIKVCLSYEEEFNIKVKVLFLNFSIFPKAEKKLKVKDYSTQKLQKKTGQSEKEKFKERTEKTKT